MKIKKSSVKLSIRKENKLKKPRFGVIEKNNKTSKINNLLPVITLVLCFIFLFIFIFKDKLLFTPDYTSTDAFHFNTSLKYFLSENLKQNILPFWTDKLQNGFPLFAEGQTGALYLPNIIILKIFPFTYTYNLLLVFSLFTLCIGFYLLLLEYKVNKWLALLMSLIFVFNGSISFRWFHLNLIQSFSLTPFLFVFLIRYYKTRNLLYGFLTALSISQMIFAGHYQVIFNSLLGLITWYIFFLKINKNKEQIKEVLIASFFIVSGFILALPQLISTFVLTLYSNRNLISSYNFAVSFPLTPQHLLSFFMPFPFGNPKNATYPMASSISWGLFWENTPYLGPTFLILITISLIIYFKSRLFQKQMNFAIFLIILFIFLSLGKDSPIYFIFDLFPFNIFRVPSKYLLMTNLFIILFLSLLLNHNFKNKSNLFKWSIVILSFLNIVGLLIVTFSYHLFVDSTLLLRNSPFTTYLTKNDVMMDFNSDDLWLKQYTEKGWKSQQDVEKYLFFNNSLQPNFNLLFSIRHMGVNTGGLKLSRSQNIYRILYSEIKKDDNITYKVSPYFFRIADLYNVSKITSAYYISNLKLVKEIQDKYKNKLYLYSISNKQIRDFYVPKKVTNVTTISELKELLATSMSEEDTLAENYKSFSQYNPNVKIETLKSSERLLQVTIKSETQTFVVFKRTWYPEWQVEIDGKKTNYIQTNLIHIGVMIPKGEHVVTVYYKPIYFIAGLIISSIFLFCFVIYIYCVKKRNNKKLIK